MIAVDAMGGDYAPREIVDGAIAAAKSGIPILLCGDKAKLTAYLKKRKAEKYPITIRHSAQVIGMGEEPIKAIKKKSDSSLMQGLKAVNAGEAQALVSAGNSGAVLIGSIFVCGRVNGIARPAVGAFLPTKTDTVFALDIGGNVDCKASYLFQFALMGHLYVSLFKNIKNPRIGLLSNGHEPYKGSAEVKRAYDVLQASSLNFVGNIESRDIFDGKVDVVVCDGFAGNIMLKAMQGTAAALFSWIKDEAEKASWLQRILLRCNKSLFTAIKRKADYATRGGALLLGIKKPIILAHGRSHAQAITNAISFAHTVAEKKQVDLFNASLKKLLHDELSFTGAVKQKVQSLFSSWKQT